MAPSKWCSPQLMTSTQHTQPARDSAAIPPSPQLFDIDDFDLLEIRASASTLDGFIAGMTTQENAESSRAVHVIKKPDANKFRAYIVLQNKQVHLGYFPDEDQAARAVDVARIYMDKGMSNFPKEEYNLPDIKASASTFDDLVASLRLEARGAFSECFAANRRRAAKQQWQYDIWKYNGLCWDGVATAVDRALIFLGEKPRCLLKSQHNGKELYRELHASPSKFEEFARGERLRADRSLSRADRLIPGK
ncbi:TPA: hypothetical protein ACH3X1_013487 [Trebouxia sp. C0004]